MVNVVERSTSNDILTNKLLGVCKMTSGWKVKSIWKAVHNRLCMADLFFTGEQAVVQSLSTQIKRTNHKLTDATDIEEVAYEFATLKSLLVAKSVRGLITKHHLNPSVDRFISRFEQGSLLNQYGILCRKKLLVWLMDLRRIASFLNESLVLRYS